ncbi:MAG TPA: hypothetical protein VGD80_22745 [Kofleriaceae bacterium]
MTALLLSSEVGSVTVPLTFTIALPVITALAIFVHGMLLLHTI